jgi:hypothetical protein
MDHAEALKHLRTLINVASETDDQTQQEGRPVHGCQKDGEEVQGRPPREV